MFCKKCGTKNEQDMTFCQHCGEVIDVAVAASGTTPIADTIKGWAGVVFGLVIIVGIIEVIYGIRTGVAIESALPAIIGLFAGVLTIVFGYILRAFVYGYGIIVNYCEKRDNEESVK